jgi:hypothetical protein
MVDEGFLRSLMRKVDTITTILKQANMIDREEWISASEAMKMLNIKSKTTLYQLRDSGSILSSQVTKRKYLYSTTSINKYLNR